VLGPATFDCSGVVGITFPATSATVSVPEGLSRSSLVLATMQNLVSGVYVAAAVPNTATGTVTITLNKAPGSSTSPRTAKVAWFVVNCTPVGAVDRRTLSCLCGAAGRGRIATRPS
jgi:hypothetical protein